MRRPIEPTVPVSDPVSRRIRDAIKNTLGWIDSGTRTQELPAATSVSSTDLIEVVLSDGNRYKSTINGAALVGPAGPAGAPGTNGTNGTNGADGADGPAGPSSFPWLAAETSPNAWDLDARNITDPDLSNNGWTVSLRDSPFTTLTRAGDIDKTAVGASGSTYRSTLYGGILMLQLPANTPVQIIKPLASGSCTIKAHCWRGQFLSGNSNYTFVSNTAQFTGGGASDVFYYTGNENTNVVAVRWVGPGGGSYSVEGGMGAINEWKEDSVHYIDHNPGVNTRFYAICTNGKALFAPTSGFNITSVSYAGVWLSHTANCMCYLDFIRRRPLNTYP